MAKIKKTTILQIQKIFTILFFLAFALMIRETLINSYNREVDLNVEKTEIISKKPNDKNYATFARHSKDHFSSSVNLLIVLLISFAIFYHSIQKKINVEKNKIIS